MLLRALLPFLFGLGSAAVSAADQPVLASAWTDVPPVIDGAGSEPAWERAPAIESFRMRESVGELPAHDRPRARLLWDREAAFFLVEIPPRLGPVEVSVLFRPSPNHGGYYHFRLRADGRFNGSFHTAGETRRSRASVPREVYRAEARGATDSDTSFRRVEGRIPWSDLAACGGRPAPGELWTATVVLSDERGPCAWTASVAPTDDPLRPEAFVPLVFHVPPALPRAAWDGGRLQGSPEPASGFAVARIWPRLDSASLVAFAPEPGTGWLWYVDQTGGRGGPMRLGRLRAAGDGGDAEVLLATDDYVTSVAFHPGYSRHGYVYLGTNGPRASRPRSSRVLRYTVREGRPDPASRTVILEWPSDGHNGGGLAFGGDGRLFVSSGDGTGEGDRDRVGQDPRTLRSKILRIDVDVPEPGRPYGVPADNPFVNDARFAPETWAYGLRNPWRLTYDSTSDQLWAGENGQDAWEFAHRVQRGANYGWSVREGSHPFGAGRTPGPTPILPPTLEFPHAEFRSLTGGVVYRGQRFPELVGAYVFGDFGTGRIWAAKHDGTKVAWVRELVDTPLAITHVTADEAGEILLADYGFERARGGPRGGAYRLVASERTTPPREFPRTLGETGLFADVRRLEPSTGVLPYRVNAPGWHDGATSSHHLALPAGRTLEVSDQKSWEAPDGTALVQTLALDGRRLETRVLLKQQEDWSAYTYLWNEDQADALLAPKEGRDLTWPDGQSWRVPSRAECMMCHSREANFALTLVEAQLNVGDQLARWEARGLFTVDLAAYERRRRRGDFGGMGRRARAEPDQRAPASSRLLPLNPSHLDRYAPPTDPDATLEHRALSYLAVNCSSCHSPSGGGNSAMNFEWRVPRPQMHAIGEPPQHGDFGMPSAKVIAPGQAAYSVLVPRMGTRGPGQMPPVATRRSDTRGLRTVIEWIQSLPPEPGAP